MMTEFCDKCACMRQGWRGMGASYPGCCSLVPSTPSICVRLRRSRSNVEMGRGTTRRRIDVRSVSGSSRQPTRSACVTANRCRQNFLGVRAKSLFAAYPVLSSARVATTTRIRTWYGTVQGCGPVVKRSKRLPAEHHVASRGGLRFALITPRSRTRSHSNAWPWQPKRTTKTRNQEGVNE